MKFFLPLTLLLTAVTFQSVAQDISGYWKGTLMMRGCFPANNIELQINSKGNVVAGDSYHYQDIDNYVKKSFRGSFDRSTKKLSLQEGIVTTYHIPQRCVICVKNFDLTYSREGNVETLKGYWNGNVLGSTQSCDGGSIILTRIKESAFKEIPEIKVDTGTIKLDFYDNAQVDGDSVIVSSPRVPNPTAVRYGWADNPTVNLYSADKLPVTPFRTDDWPRLVQKKSY